MKRKLNILLTIMGICMIILLGRLVYLQIIMGAKFYKIASVNVVRSSYILAPRGEIKDRNGNFLAYDIPRLNVCAIRAEIENVDRFVRKLSPLIGYPPAYVKKIIEKHKDNPYQKFVIKAKVDTPTMMKVAEVQLDLPGLHLEVQPVREYPCGEYASHIIGYVGEIAEDELKLKGKNYQLGDYVGKDGIEKEYDSYLKGTYGEKNVLVDAEGKDIRLISEKKPVPGKTVYLTIDMELQKETEDILTWHVKSLSKISKELLAAAAVVMDVQTGEILAMASIPEFDPNLFSKGISPKDYNKLINRKDYPLMNRIISGAYPPASTFKMVTGIAALQEGICTRYSPFICPGFYNLNGQHFNCFVKSGHGKIDFNNSIAQSCDVTFYFLGHKLGNDRLLNFAKDFGLGQRTGIDIPGESPGILPDNYWKMRMYKEPWFTGDTVNMSIGQGFLNATPLQMAVVTAAVANGGKILRPHLMSRVCTADGQDVSEYKTKILRTLKVDPGHFEAIRQGMRSAIKKGTAKAYNAKISAGGKTGTAENFPTPENPNGRNHTWFTGFAPANDPEVAIVVFFERSGNYAGRTAVPIASQILDEYAVRAKKNKQEVEKN
jgi:penicillin-binding protein 2